MTCVQSFQNSPTALWSQWNIILGFIRRVYLTPWCFLVSGPVVYVLDLADRLISKAGPFAAAGIMVGSIYWTAVTYGAVTVMQV